MALEEKKLLRAQKKKKPGFLQKFIMGVSLCLFLLLASSVAFYWLAGGSLGNLRPDLTAIAANNGDYDINNYPNKVNILVLGVDERPEGDDPGRSDTMFVLTLDTKSEQVSLLSVPRDTRTYIKGLGWDKINHAYSYGGVMLSKEAAIGLLGIPIDYYACVNFDGFYKIIDSLGGVTIDVDERMYYEDPYDDLVIDLRPGIQKLSGKKAIHYVRYRDGEGDIGRIKRQQKFIKALASEAATPLILTRLPAIIRDVSTSIKTNMTASEMVGLAKILKAAAHNGFRAETVTGTPVLIKSIDYWIPNIAELRKYLAQTQGAATNANWDAATKAQINRFYTSIPNSAEFDEIPPWLEGYVEKRYYSNTAADDTKEVAVKDGEEKEDASPAEDDKDKDKDKDKSTKTTTTLPPKKPLAPKPEQLKPKPPQNTDRPGTVPLQPSPPPLPARPIETVPVVKPQPVEKKPIEKKPIETRIPAATPAETKKPAA
ncbi:MAG: LCP family protein [Sporomusaceae bacterium]|jgi:LCP family protein required for cell wall assembly|nr:LCP family protein [Sporomusaceae bacterium]